ncbi:MAG: PSD1 and planctomycete cytochrome C domain-containing protein [Gemmataceae bacterium]|nr:PSD1 and planctomycete cytochrome C domain-containing protein [Gemmataceae bacterium]
MLTIVLLPTAWRASVVDASGQEQQPTAVQVEFFERRIRPLLVTHCYSCHSAKATKLRGELFLDTRAGVLTGGNTGPALVAGKPDESLLIKAVRYEDKDLRMPPKAKLSAAEIADLEAWVRMGAPDPRTGKQVAKQGIDIDEGRKHWSLQPIGNPSPPAVRNRDWPVGAIDHFILARLEAHGMSPASPADPRTLLRRVHFDLTGLPPTPEEIEDFVRAWDAASAKRQAKGANPRSRAMVLQQVVDRLLASPAYGERWGRHWLDVVRYADTAGDNSDYPIPQMVLYRDWVIDAIGRDMPYDQFVREQLAGDLMPAESESDRQSKIIATGYLANSRRHGSYEDARYPWHLTIEDTIDNFGKAFLGATLGCARCHDHKFDPFPAEDYYALYGFFSSTRYPWPGIELDRAQHDLVPLAPSAEIEQFTKTRQQKLAELEAKIKRLEKEKAPADSVKAAKKDREKFAKQPLPFATAYAMMDGPTEPKKRIGRVGNVRMHMKGDPERLGAEVPRRFPLVLGGQTLPGGVKGSGRLHLAKWLTEPSNPLTARVMVNRIWQYHFGRGLVATPNDFGKQGRPPTHPELLDYLARQFIDSGWSIKAMHRLIVLSATYQQASEVSETSEVLSRDPDNELLSHFPRRRLDAESIRDAILAVSGGLDRSRGGPHPFPAQPAWDFTQHKPFKAVYDSNRRSVYLMTQRIQRHPFLALFDGPDTNASTAARTTSTTSLQALYLMNDPFVHEQARKLAARLLAERSDDAGRIHRAFVLAFGRPPAAAEAKQARRFLDQVGDVFESVNIPGEQRAARRWESFARALFMSSEFVYIN